ncbi:pyridoxamine 5'-phosphate oxidase family protein [Streptomyces virginiae]|uniref:pyridoxamine 5'-phosphate oxidase family protein n=1 Tax=Streptomyces virginiae TaxID=1961 RepID=UPI0035D60277
MSPSSNTVLDSALHHVLDAYLTCEFVTLGRDGTPMAWPTAVARRDDGTLLLTTSLAFAQKALNVRRDGRVALLFSDPTGSGLDPAPQVFVSGRAECPDTIMTGRAEPRNTGAGSSSCSRTAAPTSRVPCGR